MSEETKSSNISLVEIIALGICVLVVIFIFTARKDVPDRERELANALRFQHVSEIANALWQSSLNSTEFERIVNEISWADSCRDSSVIAENFEAVLVPDYFQTTPRDPKEGSYQVFIDEAGRVTVCAFGEEVDGSVKYISITR